MSTNGKGVSGEEAAASAYAEMVERISGNIVTSAESAIRRELTGTKAALLEEVGFFKYMDGYRWAHQDSLPNPVRAEDFLKGHNFIDRQFEDLKFRSEFLRHWVKGYNLNKKKDCQVPLLFAKWISTTNGLAAGNTIEEAIIHGFCEILERYHLIRFLNGEAEPMAAIYPESIPDERIQSILKFFKDNNVDIQIKLLSDFPVYAVITTNNNLTKDMLYHSTIKAGCSLDHCQALLRCFTERMQGTDLLREKNSLAKKDSTNNPNRNLPLFYQGLCSYDLNHLRSKGATEEFRDIVGPNGTEREIQLCAAEAEMLNTEIIVIDHTHPVLNFPAVRVICPGVSDFMKWWDPSKININFLGNIHKIEEEYEDTLMRVLRTFVEPHQMGGRAAQNSLRRDT